MRITAAVMEKADGTLRSRKLGLEEVELEPPRLMRYSCGSRMQACAAPIVVVFTGSSLIPRQVCSVTKVPASLKRSDAK